MIQTCLCVRQTTIHVHIHTDSQFRITNYCNVHIVVS